ncbi:MAG: aminotransferase class I/II-fold pyridoxal phosphate-dependent enzyme [Bacteroidetes bacterium]|nr:aminotransferase class I/II-fold pyridoxal phosphate-dependent enzyme [Bacteroidota bacterium]
MIQTAKRLGEVKEYYFSMKLREIAKMKAEGKAVLNLGIGSPDLPPNQDTLNELIRQSRKEDNHAYQSYSGIPELRKAFSSWYEKWYNVHLDSEREILPLMGSKEGIMHISMTFLEKGDRVLIPNPGYPAYRAVSNLTGATVEEYELGEATGWLPDLKKLEQRDLSDVKIMWINYPHMPTGTKATRSFFEKLVAFAHKHQILICNDNPYSFILNEEPLSIFSVDGAKDVALELNSLSKSHNMAGWRVGMIGGKATYLNHILRFKSNMDSGMFKPLQMAAAVALNSPASWYDRLNGAYKSRRKKAFELLNLLDCTYTDQQVGMFVWAKVSDRYADGYELSDEILHKAHVFLTPGGIFGSQGNKYIRISLCSNTILYEEATKRIRESEIFPGNKVKEKQPKIQTLTGRIRRLSLRTGVSGLFFHLPSFFSKKKTALSR